MASTFFSVTPIDTDLDVMHVVSTSLESVPPLNGDDAVTGRDDIPGSLNMGTLTRNTKEGGKALERVVVVSVDELHAEFLHFAASVRKDLAAMSSQLRNDIGPRTPALRARSFPVLPVPSTDSGATQDAGIDMNPVRSLGRPKSAKILRKRANQVEFQHPNSVFSPVAHAPLSPVAHAPSTPKSNAASESSAGTQSARVAHGHSTPGPKRFLEEPPEIDSPLSPISADRSWKSSGPTSPKRCASAPSTPQRSVSTAFNLGSKKVHIETHRGAASKVTREEDLEKSPELDVLLINDRSLTNKLQYIVSLPAFDSVVVVIILLNGIVVGVQTDYLAQQLQETPPVAFQAIEVFFCFIFTSEIVMRLWVYGCRFFTMTSRAWNIFDLFIVLLQIVEVLTSLITAGSGYSFSILRVLRFLRVIRLARALRLISELRTIVTSIAGALKSLFWTAFLLFMVVYVLAVYTTQVVLNKRISFNNAGIPTPVELELYWGSLILSILSLFQSITGGVDWDVVVRPLMDHISPTLGLLFACYITITVFALLNVITGVFIDAVMKNAAAEDEEQTRSRLRRLFHGIGLREGDSIDYAEFDMLLPRKEMKEFFKTIDVDILNAQHLFELLDADHSGSLDMEELIDGCLKIWAPCQSLDMQLMRRDLNALVLCLQGVEEPNLTSLPAKSTSLAEAFARQKSPTA